MLQKNRGVNSQKWIIIPKHFKTQPNSIMFQGFEGGLSWLSTYLPGSLWILGSLMSSFLFQEHWPMLGPSAWFLPMELEESNSLFLFSVCADVRGQVHKHFHLGSFPCSASANGWGTVPFLFLKGPCESRPSSLQSLWVRALTSAV